MALTPIPPNEPLPRRYWTYSNRPFNGCGCLWPLLLGIALSVIVSLLLPNTSVLCLPFIF